MDADTLAALERAAAALDIRQHTITERQTDMQDAALIRALIERERSGGERAQVVAFQQGVDAWMDACFGRAIKADMLERADRFCEEALELCQTMPGFGAERAHALVDYVFNRSVGERRQEVGGVMVTLAALCNAAKIDMAEAGEVELARVWTKVEAIRAKQAAKPTGSALPVAIAAGAHIGTGGE